MFEANKAKMLAANQSAAVQNTNANANANRVTLQGQIFANNQNSILNIVNKINLNSKLGDKKGVANIPENKKVIDEESQRGRFGWVTLGKAFIPYIIRQGEQYTAVRMVESKLLNKYLSYLHPDIYNCTCIRSYYITDAEARVLNEINVRHCDAQFGRDHFTNKDLVVRLQDAAEFYNFLDVCYNKLVLSSNNPRDKCGFIRINGESVVPYTIRNSNKYVPLFYFEGETDSLKLKAEKLEGWDLAYLKFCCKVQGIKNELFSSDTCSVISLNDIKSYFPAGTSFEDYWPSKVIDSQLLITSKNQNPYPSWTKQPAGTLPPSVTKPVAPIQRSVPVTHTPPMAGTPGPHGNLPAAVINGWAAANIISGQQYQAMVSQQNNIVRMAQAQSLQNNVSFRCCRLFSSYPTDFCFFFFLTGDGEVPQMGMVQQPPPPLVRATLAQNIPIGTPTYTNTTSVPGTLHVLQSDRSNRIAYAASLLRNTQSTRSSSNQQKSNNSVQMQTYGSNAKPPPPLIPVNGTSRSVPSKESSGSKKLIQIIEIPPLGSQAPYQVKKVLVDNKMVPCINAKPYIYSDLLMTLPDLVKHFFPNTPVGGVQKILQEVLLVNLYKGNRSQMETLRLAGKCVSETENLPLIQVRDVMKYMPQMKYVLEHNKNDPVAKRQRTS
ncbi:conserved hypothetical protein [Pediculus humanus corporis]|uniref:Uncharacterized protein n=1 Tax=Pediculus humanus subsp. corporis TaxID=121224 RepID=E0VRJ6_PEDHC|nr:uncharacterized protein Phum_PHUM399480 [Pediculus humanus corporis]EEB16002.1 conserved hypothetical protein [Pediculus humanus corporis]